MRKWLIFASVNFLILDNADNTEIPCVDGITGIDTKTRNLLHKYIWIYISPTPNMGKIDDLDLGGNQSKKKKIQNSEILKTKRGSHCYFFSRMYRNNNKITGTSGKPLSWRGIDLKKKFLIYILFTTVSNLDLFM